jgi:hypothetical protein
MAQRKAYGLGDLMAFHSWKLDRLSPTTYPQDVTIRLEGLTQDEIEFIGESLRKGQCFRCRIAKGRYYFGVTPSAAIRLAVGAEVERRAAKKPKPPKPARPSPELMAAYESILGNL